MKSGNKIIGTVIGLAVLYAMFYVGSKGWSMGKK